jgi:transposase, IS5 family
MKSYKPSFFDESERYIKLDKLDDPLIALNEYIDFEIFRAALDEIFEKPRLSNVGRKSLDVVLMFKILMLQRLYNLSDQQIEFQVNDRLSFGRFLGLPLGGAVPDYTTVWKVREVLVRADAVKALFGLVSRTLSEKGLITKEGTIVDASFVEVPRQRNTKEENDLVKIKKIPEARKEQPAKLR